MTNSVPGEGRSAAVATTLGGLDELRTRVQSVTAGRRHVLFVARGPSENAATYGTYLVQTEAHLRAAIFPPSVSTHYHSRMDLSDCVVVSISTSGSTVEAVETQAWASKAGARTIAITDEPDSPLGSGADVVLATHAAQRYGQVPVPYASQLAAVAWVVSTLPGVDPRLGELLYDTPAELARLQAAELDLSPVVAELRSSRQVYVVSRGLCLGTADATARLLQERWGHPVVGLTYTDLRFGPLGAVEPGIVVVVLAASDGPLLDGLTEMVGAITSRGACAVGIGGDERFRDACSLALPGTDLPEELAPIGLVVPVQRLAAALGG